MTIHCPHCQFEMALKGARAGRFAPRCQQCGNTFSLTISPDPAVAPVVVKIDPATVPGPATASPGGNGQPPPGLSGQLGDFRLIRLLAQGTTGDVYQAREPMLERDVAVKVLAADLAADAPFAARFTREAFAVAQLAHPNLVHVHDIGADREQYFYSMELVGRDVISQTSGGRMDPEAAAACALQAARGLKYAHDRGMMHRDIKPANLLLDEQGLVKVADLGLIKRPNSSNAEATGMNPRAARFQNTLANLVAGTPAYMSPEQAQDAAHIDSRSDIYSLGCSLYDLLTGRPPFMGRTAIEIITRHQREPITPPDMIVRTIPRTLSSIVMKMLGKRLSERTQTMAEVIHDLEEFLGVGPNGPFAPKVETIKGIEEAAARFNRSGWVVLRGQLLTGFVAACAIGAAVLLWLDRPGWMALLIGLVVLGAISYQAIVGVTQQTPLFVRLRQLVRGASRMDWIVWGILLGLAGIMLVASGWLFPWVAAAIFAVPLALALHYSVDQLVLNDRRRVLEEVQTMLRHFRDRGYDEGLLRQLVCRASGERWEEMYEMLFGYEAKVEARRARTVVEGEPRARKHAAWRDPIIGYADRKLRARKAARQRRVIQEVERLALMAEGKPAEEAQKLSKVTAGKVMAAARRLREGIAPKKPEAIPLPPHLAALMTPAAGARVALAPAAAPPPAPPESIMNIINRVSAETVRDAMEAGDEPEEEEGRPRRRLSWFQRRFGTPVDLVIGRQVRFVLAVLILVGFGLWWRQSKVDPALAAAASVAGTQREVQVSADPTEITRSTVDVVIRSADHAMARSGSRVLEIPHVPRTIRIALSGWNAGLAGLILLVSVMCHGRLMALTVILAAAIALVGHWFEIPQIGTPQPWMSAAVAAGLGLVTMMFLRRPEGI